MDRARGLRRLVGGLSSRSSSGPYSRGQPRRERVGERRHQADHTPGGREEERERVGERRTERETVPLRVFLDAGG